MRPHDISFLYDDAEEKSRKRCRWTGANFAHAVWHAAGATTTPNDVWNHAARHDAADDAAADDGTRHDDAWHHARHDAARAARHGAARAARHGAAACGDTC